MRIGLPSGCSYGRSGMTALPSNAVVTNLRVFSSVHALSNLISRKRPLGFVTSWMPGSKPDLTIGSFSSFEGFAPADRKSTRLNSSHLGISYAVFCLKKLNYRAMDSLCDLSLSFVDRRCHCADHA